MSKRIFSSEEIETLLGNENVSKCSDRSISFSKEFKLRALEQYNEGMSSSEVFKRAGFDLNLIGKDLPSECLRRWRKVFALKGINGLIEEARGKGGGRPKTKYKTIEEENEYLKVKIAYLDAENDFLAKMRGIRRG
jgi:transposase-like protein